MVILPEKLLRFERNGVPYLNMGEIEKGEVFEIVNSGEYREYKQKENFEIQMKREKDGKVYWIRMTSEGRAMRTLARNLGNNTDTWVGEKVYANKVYVDTPDGYKKLAVIFLPVKQNE
jgi:hypothetical protein